MSKTTIAVIGLVSVLLIAGGAGGYLFINSRNQSESETDTASDNPLNNLVTQIKNEEKTYQDESGFSFKYTSDFSVKDDTPEDGDYYTFLTISKGSEKGTISIADTKHKTVQKWVDSGTDIPSDAKLNGAVSLGGISASQYTAAEKLYTAAVDQGVLYVIQTPKTDLWEKLQEKVISSFSFGLAKTKTNQSASGSNSDIIYEAEEVVE